jgi:hypothetical protein
MVALISHHLKSEANGYSPKSLALAAVNYSSVSHNAAVLARQELWSVIIKHGTGSRSCLGR